jgi:hypothetical protein
MLNRTAILLIVYAAICGFVVGGSLFALYPSPRNHQTAIEDSYKGAEKFGTQIAAPKTADNRIADYTWWVAAFTGALVVVSAVQITFLLRSDETARITANAAILNAKAAIGVELPIIIFRLTLNREPGVHGPILDAPGPVSTLMVQFWNRGRSAAEMLALYADWIVASSLPDAPIYRKDISYAPGSMLEAGGEPPRGAKTEPLVMTLRDEEVASIKSRGAQSLWVYGYLLYKDFVGEKHQTPFCARWLVGPEIPTGAAGRFIYDPDTPTAYVKKT